MKKAEQPEENKHRPVQVNVPNSLEISKSVHEYFEKKLCTIPLTSPPTEDPFVTYTPKPKTVVAYDLEQTETELKRPRSYGCIQLHVRQTQGFFKIPPPEFVFPDDEKVKDTTQYTTGGPPCWEFRDEKFLREEEKRQAKYRKNLKLLIRENRKFEKNRRVIKLPYM